MIFTLFYTFVFLQIPNLTGSGLFLTGGLFLPGIFFRSWTLFPVRSPFLPGGLFPARGPFPPGGLFPARGPFSCPEVFSCPEAFSLPGAQPRRPDRKKRPENGEKKRREKAKKSGGRSQLSPPSRRIRKGGGETLPPHLAAAGRIPHGVRAPGPDRSAKIGILAEKAAPRGGKRRSGAARPLNRRFPSGRRWRSRS